MTRRNFRNEREAYASVLLGNDGNDRNDCSQWWKCYWRKRLSKRIQSIESKWRCRAVFLLLIGNPTWVKAQWKPSKTN